MMPVVIFCGGLGTRFPEETESKPKPMIEIGGRSLLARLIEIFERQGFDEIILCAGYKGAMIRQAFPRHLCVDTGETAPTGARLAAVLPFVSDRSCLVTYGDGLANIDCRALVQHHETTGTIATLTAVHPWANRFGVLGLAGNLVVTFREKPADLYINGGFMVCNPEIATYLSLDEGCVFERVLEQLALAGELGAYRHDGFWACMDTRRDWLILNDMCERGERPWEWTGATAPSS